MTHAHHFTVEGLDPFPTDMLRYDGCYPESESNLPHIGHNYHGQDSPEPYQVRLVHVDEYKHWQPTDGRWRSFGWRVVEQQ